MTVEKKEIQGLSPEDPQRNERGENPAESKWRVSGAEGRSKLSRKSRGMAFQGRGVINSVHGDSWAE